MRNAFAAYEVMDRWQPVMAYLPVEPVIKRRQQAYNDQLAAADAQADCSGFIEFILTAIEESLHEAINADHRPETPGKTRRCGQRRALASAG